MLYLHPGLRPEIVETVGRASSGLAYVQHGHWFYVTGEIPPHKDPRVVDAKLIERYHLDISKWARARAKAQGRASVQYIRHGRFFVLIATKGRHEFYNQESDVLDIRRQPIRYVGYSISFRRGVDRRWHVSVRIAPDEYLRLKSFLVGFAVHRSVDNLVAALQGIPFEPYAPVRRQLFNILRAVNRARHAAGYEPVPASALRLRRRPVKPFLEASTGGRRHVERLSHRGEKLGRGYGHNPVGLVASEISFVKGEQAGHRVREHEGDGACVVNLDTSDSVFLDEGLPDFGG